MKLTKLLVNHLENPLGFALGATPRLSWVVEDCETDEKTALYRVELASDAAFTALLFDSGFSRDIDSICYPLPFSPLQARTRYYWRVSLNYDDDITTSAPAFFETGKMNEPWSARWISPVFPPSRGDRHPVLMTQFTLKDKPKAARLYLCGLGLYTFTINGTAAFSERLAPGLCAYDKWLPYQTSDILPFLEKGDNTLEVTLGNGWYKGRYGLDRNREFHYGEEFALIAELHIDYRDGTHAVITTTTQEWKARFSSIITSNIFDGETRDDTMDDTSVYAVKENESLNARINQLEARRSVGIRVMHELKPVAVVATSAGETVLDMGQNMVGVLRFRNYAACGERIRMQFGEVLQGGNFYRDNLRTALAEFTYTSDGESKYVEQTFTFYGFRYVKLTEWHGPVRKEDFTGLVLYSALRETGSIITGNEKVNRLFLNALWGQRGNYLDVPTDCPQRDERMGWTGDTQMFFGTAAYNMDVAPFFSKVMRDMVAEQQALDGDVPVVIPKHDVTQTGACAWGDAATIIPWNMYVRYGDKTMLAEQYNNMTLWVNHLRAHDAATGNTRLWRGDFHYADWLSLDTDGGLDSIGTRFGGTDAVFLASCFYYHSACLTAQAARVLEKKDDEALYRTLAEEIRAAILTEYVTASGRLAVTTQTAYVLALFFDILPEKWRPLNARSLRMKLKDSHYHLRTGFIGTAYLCRVLSANGSNDIAYKLLLQEDYPSWLYEVNMGATTIWERWNSILSDGSISDTGMNSLNHYAYGSIVEWLYRDAAGINPIETAPGFRRFRLAPRPERSLHHLAASYDSPCGRITSAWRYHENGELELSFTVPFGATAECLLPDCHDSEIHELHAGRHTFRYIPRDAHIPRYHFDTPLSDILKNPQAKKVFAEHYPRLAGMMLFEMLAGEKSLDDFIYEGYITPDEEEKEAVIAAMNA